MKKALVAFLALGLLALDPGCGKSSDYQSCNKQGTNCYENQVTSAGQL